MKCQPIGNSPYPQALQAAHLHVPAMSRISPTSTCAVTPSMSAARSWWDLSMYVPQIILQPLCRPWHHLPFHHICAACNPILYASYLGFFQSVKIPYTPQLTNLLCEGCKLVCHHPWPHSRWDLVHSHFMFLVGLYMKCQPMGNSPYPLALQAAHI